MKSLIQILFCLVITTMPLLSETETVGSGASSSRAIYQASLDKINSDSFAQSLEWANGYRKALEEFQDARQKAGDLEGWRAAKNEIDRFKSGRKLDALDIVSDSEGLKSIQQQHLQNRKAFTEEKQSRLISLTDKYCKHLMARQTELTKTGKMDEAIAFNDELSRVKGTQLYKDSLEVAVSESVEPIAADDSTGKQVSNGITVPDSMADDESSFVVQAPIVHPGFTMYKQGKAPRTLNKGVVYRSVPLRDTGVSGVVREISCAASVKKDLVPVKTATPRVSAPGQEVIALKVGLKSARSDTEFSDITLLLQYFGKFPKSNDGDRIRELLSQAVTIPSLDKDLIIAECPPVVIGTTAATAASGDGAEFYGVVITVLDLSRTVIYQAVSQPGLSDRGDQSIAALERAITSQEQGAAAATPAEPAPVAADAPVEPGL